MKCVHDRCCCDGSKNAEEWSWRWLVIVYKGKGDALKCGSYRGINLLELAMKVLERVIGGRL